MYYKIENKESDIYKALRQFRQNEIEINLRNRETVLKTIPYEWDRFQGYAGQLTFERVTAYHGFMFREPEKVDLKVWRRNHETSEVFVPNLRTKKGREMRDFLHGLEAGSVFELFTILGFEDTYRFKFPYLETCGDTLVLYLDGRMVPEDENIIEITYVEFEQIRNGEEKKP